MKLTAPQSHILKHMTAGWTLSSDAKNEPFLRSGIMTESVDLVQVRNLILHGLVHTISLYPTTRYVLTEAGRKAAK